MTAGLRATFFGAAFFGAAFFGAARFGAAFLATFFTAFFTTFFTTFFGAAFLAAFFGAALAIATTLLERATAVLPAAGTGARVKAVAEVARSASSSLSGDIGRSGGAMRVQCSPTLDGAFGKLLVAIGCPFLMGN